MMYAVSHLYLEPFFQRGRLLRPQDVRMDPEGFNGAETLEHNAESALSAVSHWRRQRRRRSNVQVRHRCQAPPMDITMLTSAC